MTPRRMTLTLSDMDVTGEERFFVIAEGLEGEAKAIRGVFSTISEAKRFAENVKDDTVSVSMQIGYGFREEKG
jgi:hypothetical protein